MFTNDRFPRATNADGSLQTEADWKVEPTRVERGASIGSQRDHRLPASRSATARWSAPARSSPATCRTTRSSPACRPASSATRDAIARQRLVRRPMHAGQEDERVINIGVVGYGYWGPNLVRNFAETPGADVAAVADLTREQLDVVQRRYPGRQDHDRLQRPARRPAHRRDRDRHAGQHALRAGHGGAAGRQARLAREADDRDLGRRRAG